MSHHRKLEIDNTEGTIFTSKDISRFKVTMQEPLLMQSLENSVDTDTFIVSKVNISPHISC
ncbi:hypothetical protein BT96DRAFT_927570, partial [Gymnopus androsaceus JB14]